MMTISSILQLLSNLAYLRLDTGAPVGLPGPYPQVFQASKLIPGPVKIFSHGSPGSPGKKPVGHRYSQVNPLFYRYSKVPGGIPTGHV